MSAMPSGVGTSCRPICRGRLLFGGRWTISCRLLSHTTTYLRSIMFAMCWLMDASVPIPFVSISETSSCSCKNPGRFVILSSTRMSRNVTRSPFDNLTSSVSSCPPRTSFSTHGIAPAYPISSTTTCLCSRATALPCSNSSTPNSAVTTRYFKSPRSDARKCRTTYSYTRHSTGLSSCRFTQRVGVIGSWSPTRRPLVEPSLFFCASKYFAVRPQTG
mmetsp:Transcript_4444/g.9572  ORF Transcript_4444/g.9572 Transcript_4444/m.9572 type:complete len:217 (-) Transcript_4444:9-659(-)